MARRELGGKKSKSLHVPLSLTHHVGLSGVVDSHLRVHGTANLRIVDTSIIPIPLAAHIQATAYAIGEKVRALFCVKTFIRLG